MSQWRKTSASRPLPVQRARSNIVRAIASAWCWPGRAGARELDLPVEAVNQTDRLVRRLFVAEAELAREELRVDVLLVRRRGVEVEVAGVQAGLLQDRADVRGPRARNHRDVFDLAHPRKEERDDLILLRRPRPGTLARLLSPLALRVALARPLRLAAHNSPSLLFVPVCRKRRWLLYHFKLKIDCLPAHDEAEVLLPEAAQEAQRGVAIAGLH